MKINPAHIPSFTGTRTLVKNEADNSDLRKAILNAVPTATKQTKKLAPYFRRSSEQETCRAIFDFIKNKIKYKADGWRQVVQMPSAVLRPGAVADCKSMSLFTAGILSNLGIPYHFVLASYNNSPVPGHIYVQTKGGCIIDAVWGKFNSEKKSKYRYNMEVTYLAGIDGLGKTKAGKFFQKVGTGAKKVATKVASKGKTAVLAPGRNLFLLLVKNNLDGLGEKLAKMDPGKLRNAWNKAGGNWTVLQKNIKTGASKKSKKIGLLKILKKAGINGIGAVNQAAVVSAATAVGTAVAGPSGTAAGTSLGAVLMALSEILPQLISMTKAEDVAGGDAVGLPAGTALDTAAEDVEGGSDQKGDDKDKSGDGGKKNTMLIIGGVAVAAAVLYFATRKKK